MSNAPIRKSHVRYYSIVNGIIKYRYGGFILGKNISLVKEKKDNGEIEYIPSSDSHVKLANFSNADSTIQAINMMKDKSKIKFRPRIWQTKLIDTHFFIKMSLEEVEQTKDSLEKELDELNNENMELNKDMMNLNSEINKLSKDNKKLTSNIEIEKKKTNNLLNKIKTMETQLNQQKT